jgi:prefoldin subunit 5
MDLATIEPLIQSIGGALIQLVLGMILAVATSFAVAQKMIERLKTRVGELETALNDANQKIALLSAQLDIATAENEQLKKQQVEIEKYQRRSGRRF